MAIKRKQVHLDELLLQIHRPIEVKTLSTVPFAGLRWYAQGVYPRDVVEAESVKTAVLNSLEEGDVTYNRMWATKAAFGVVGRDASGCLVTNDFPVFRTRESLTPSFLRLVFQSRSFQVSAAVAATGTTERRRLKERDFLKIEISLPSLDEQRRIVDLVSSVDTYIAALEQQADSARRARNAVLHELLSAGGDDWTQTTLGEVMSVSIGGIWGGDVGTDELDVPVYRQTEFEDNGRLSMPSDAIRSISKSQLKTRRLQPGDVLLQKSAGTPTLPGRVVMVPRGIEENATCSNFLQLVRADVDKCEPSFLFWELWRRHNSGGAFEFQRGTNIRNLDLNQYFAQPLLLPPLLEQKRIVEIVTSLDSAIQTTGQVVDNAKRLRAGLLSELLSGEHEIPESYDRLLGAA